MTARTNRIIPLLIVAFVLATIAPTFTGKVIYVDDDAPGANDGSSWADAYNFLQDALAAAQSGDEIRVAQGIYKPDEDSAHPGGTGDREATFQLINSVTLKGGYAGFGNSEPNARDVAIYETILNGDLAGDDIELTNPADMWGEQSRRDNSEHVVTGSYVDANAILDGFTITAGRNGGLGAGMYNRDSNPTVTNCTFTWNSAEWGGGMCNWNSSPKVIDCKFVSNAAMGGGGIDNMRNSTPILMNCTFSRNSGFWRGGGMLNSYAGVGGSANPILINCIFNGNSTDRHGGGIYNAGSNPTITNCTFSDNAAGVGGGIFTTTSSPTLTNCTFSSNSANSGGGMYCGATGYQPLTNCTFNGNSASDSSGGMYNEGSLWSESNCSPTLTDCAFNGNSASDSGGGMFNSGSSPTLKNCTFSNNSADFGGGMFTTTSSPTLTNCTFSSNSAVLGGGMYNEDASPKMTFCTFSENSADWKGAGIYNERGSSPTLTNCTFTDNSAVRSGQGAGGGMCNQESDLMLINCIFSRNSADFGGGMANWRSSPTLTNCTFNGNSARGIGGGMCNGQGCYTMVSNCIFWGNGSYGISGSAIDATYSDIEGGWPGEGNIDADPCFVDLGYWDTNDTPYEPQDDVWIEGDYHLLPGSPCIDAGDPNHLFDPNETDLDGRPRVVGGRIDMGAYEYSPLVAKVRIIPRTINLNSKGKWITCYIWPSEDYDVADIDPNSVFLEYEIQPEQLFINEQEQVATAIFSREEVQAILNIGEIELTINAQLTDATYFEGTDVIKVIDKDSGQSPKYIQASNPNPADGATNVSTNADLSWMASPYATSHNVYFGTSSQPPFVCNQTATTFDTNPRPGPGGGGGMAFDTTYYWHIDEVNKWGITTGQLWRFTTLRGPGPGTTGPGTTGPGTTTGPTGPGTGTGTTGPVTGP